MSVHIIVNNSLCQVVNHSKEMHKELSEKLRFKDQAIEFSYDSNLRKMARLNLLLSSDKFFGNKEKLQRELWQCVAINRELEKDLWRPLFDSDGYFPTGLLPMVRSIFEIRDERVEIKDQRKKPTKSVNFVLREQFPPMRYYQKDANSELQTHHRGVVVMPTGTGKTKTACRMIWELGVKTLIVTPGKSIVSLMMTDLVKHFGKGKVQKLTTKSVKTKEINVVNIQAMALMDPKIFEDMQAVIIDEFHHAAADTYLVANEDHLKNCYYRIGLTATNFRNDGAGLALESVLSNVLYEYPIKQAIKDGYLMQPEFEWVPITLGEGQSYQKAYKEEIVENDERNEKIAEIVDRHADDHVLILVKQVEHGERLKELLPDAEFIHGLTKDDDREDIMNDFRKGKLKCLIGTSVIGEGVDLPVANVLIMAGGGKARSQIMQNIGRILRILEGKEFAKVYDFTDSDGTWLGDHAEQRREIYKIY